MIANDHFENDINYTFQLNRLVFRLLGIWPLERTKLPLFLIVACYFLLCFELIPNLLYIIIVEKQTSIKIKLSMPVIFTLLEMVKYTNLLLFKSRVKSCLTRIENDWRNVSARARDCMLDKVKSGRRLCLLCCLFMYTTGMFYRTIAPLTKGKIVSAANVTIRLLPCPSHFILFDAQHSPVYEIIFFVQFLSGFVKYTIAIATCSLAALLAMHICAQLEILMMLMNDMVNDDRMEHAKEKLIVIVSYQNETRSFFYLVQETLQHFSLVELTGCTTILCLLGYYVIAEWQASNFVTMFTYFVAGVSITFNIFIFCYIGEQLSLEGEKLALTACTLDWHRLPNAKARALILVMAMSISPTKLKAGKFMDLSLKTFGNVVKTAVTYFNFLRQLID